MDTGSPTLLRKTDDRRLDVLCGFACFRAGSSRHCKVGILIDDNHQIWKILMSIGRKQIPVLILLVVKFEVVHAGKGKKFITLIHLDTERIEHEFGLLRILHDCVFLLILLAGSHRHDGKIMLQESII